MEHFNSLAADPDLVEQTLDILDPTLGICITFQVMTGAFQSAGHHNTVRAAFECL